MPCAINLVNTLAQKRACAKLIRQMMLYKVKKNRAKRRFNENEQTIKCLNWEKEVERENVRTKIMFVDEEFVSNWMAIATLRDSIKR